MIALTFALPAESSGVVGLTREKKTVDQITYGKLARHDVAILHTGVGRKACERSISDLLHVVQPKLLISAGFAGSVNAELQVGEMIVAENFSDRDWVAAVEGGAPATPSLSSREFVPPKSGMAKVRVVKLFTANSIVDSVEERNRIALESGADAVDMETEIIAQACRAKGIRMVSLRVITDTPEAPFPIPPSILFDINRQKTNPIRLISYLIRHPSTFAPLLRFSRQVAKARNALTDSLATLLRNEDL
jgi:adenosylhomocysteine nucleosidase